MLRTQISLHPAERRILDLESARTGRSISALIREAVTHTYGPTNDATTDLAAIDAALGTWSEHAVDGAQYVERLRSGSRLDDASAR